MVSDGAKALVKLALDGLKCPAVPDVFHMLRDFGKSMGGTISLQQARLQKEYLALTAKSSSNSKAQLLALAAQQLQLANDRNDYQDSIHALSQSIHPFDLKTGEAQIGLGATSLLAASSIHLRTTKSNLLSNQKSSCFGAVETTTTILIRRTSCLVGVGASSSWNPNPRPRNSQLGIKLFATLGLLASTNAKDSPTTA
jgi:hypothetical protein